MIHARLLTSSCHAHPESRCSERSARAFCAAKTTQLLSGEGLSTSVRVRALAKRACELRAPLPVREREGDFAEQLTVHIASASGQSARPGSPPLGDTRVHGRHSAQAGHDNYRGEFRLNERGRLCELPDGSSGRCFSPFWSRLQWRLPTRRRAAAVDLGSSATYACSRTGGPLRTWQPSACSPRSTGNSGWLHPTAWSSPRVGRSGRVPGPGCTTAPAGRSRALSPGRPGETIAATSPEVLRRAGASRGVATSRRRTRLPHARRMAALEVVRPSGGRLRKE